MQLLGAAHGPLLLLLLMGVVVGIPTLLLAAINNLKVDVIIHYLGLNGGTSTVRKGCRVVCQEERLLSQERCLPYMSDIHVIICLR
jgi:hypothetical protein